MEWRQYAKSKTGQRNLKAIGFFIAFYCLLTLLSALSQERLVYSPSEQDFLNCPQIESFGLAPLEHNGTRFYGPNEISSSSKVVVVYHGNAGSACNRAYYLPYIAGAGAKAMLVEYTGYSNDTVSPSHDGIKKDVENITNFLAEKKLEHVIIIGESIGAGPAVLHANNKNPDQLILITPFTSLLDLANHHYWYFPTKLLVNNAYDNLAYLQNYDGTVALIHGTDDNIVPFEMSQKIVQINPDKITLHTIENAAHNNLLRFPEFYTALSNALAE